MVVTFGGNLLDGFERFRCSEVKTIEKSFQRLKLVLKYLKISLSAAGNGGRRFC